MHEKIDVTYHEIDTPEPGLRIDAFGDFHTNMHHAEVVLYDQSF